MLKIESKQQPMIKIGTKEKELKYVLNLVLPVMMATETLMVVVAAVPVAIQKVKVLFFDNLFVVVLGIDSAESTPFLFSTACNPCNFESTRGRRGVDSAKSSTPQHVFSTSKRPHLPLATLRYGTQKCHSFTPKLPQFCPVSMGVSMPKPHSYTSQVWHL